jgi:hypothetical protein
LGGYYLLCYLSGFPLPTITLTGLIARRGSVFGVLSVALTRFFGFGFNNSLTTQTDFCFCHN